MGRAPHGETDGGRVPISREAIAAGFRAALSRADSDRAAADELCLACEHLLEVDGAAVTLVHEGTSRGVMGASNARSRRLEEHQFTFGEGPCLDAATSGGPVLVPDLRSPDADRWPFFAGAAVGEDIHGVFAIPIVFASAGLGALDLFRTRVEPLTPRQVEGAVLAARLASRPLLNLLLRGIEHADGGTDVTGADGIDRIEVYQATGMLMDQLDVDADEAVLRLRAHAMVTEQTAGQVAFAIIGGQLRLERDDPYGGTGSEGSHG